jgi:predicted RND superfamily exporter protein
LPDDDPDAALFKQIGKEFGGNNIGMIILETDNIFKKEVIEHVHQITDTLRLMDGISSVTSLTNIMEIKSSDFGIEVGKLVDEYDLPDTPLELDSLRNRIFEKEMYIGSIVSEDGTATLIMFTLIDGADVQIVARNVRHKMESLQLEEKLYYAGSPMLVTYIADLISADLIKLIPIAFFLIALVLFFSFKTLRGVLLPLLTAAIAITWSLGMMAILGFEVTMISNNIPIILLAVGSAYTIHVLNRIELHVETDRKKAITSALSFIFIPVLLSALTTALGFISFIFGAYLEMIKAFGIFTALGTTFACLITLIFIPALISAFTFKSEPVESKPKKSLLSKYFLTPVTILLFKHPKNIFITWSLLIVMSVFGILQIKRSVNIQDYFREGNPTRKAEIMMTEKFGGTKPVFVLFKGDMHSPDVLNTMMRAEEYMKQSPDIHTTQSIADIVRQLNNAMGEGDQIPDSRDKIEQLWFFIDGNEMLQQLVNDDLDKGLIISKFISPENSAKIAFTKYMETFIRENSTEECQIQITGMPFVDVTMDSSLLRSQLGSLSLAIVFMLIIVSLILRSISNGLFAIVPIISTIIVLFGFMGATGIPLNIATVLVASAALGIGIDYSIHIISHFDHSYKNGENIKQAIESTLANSGKAIVINVVSVSAGFLVLLFSEMVPLRYFGLLIALSMVGSSLGALTLLPATLILFKGKKKTETGEK